MSKTLKLDEFMPLTDAGPGLEMYISKDQKQVVALINVGEPKGSTASGNELLGSTKGNLRIPTANCHIGINAYRKVEKAAE